MSGDTFRSLRKSAGVRFSSFTNPSLTSPSPTKKGVKSNVRLFYACSTNSTKLTAFLGKSTCVIKETKGLNVNKGETAIFAQITNGGT